jgi:hypothetical protein
MKELAKNIISMLTMKRTLKTSFVDKVSGKTVFFYKDKYGIEWMSEYPYYPFKFRAKTEK